MTGQALPPHKTLKEYYSSESDRQSVVRELFNSGAPSYEFVCRAMSLGTGAHYRWGALRSAGLTEGMWILDVATGTGLVLRAAVDIVGPNGRAVGLDPSPGMLSECRKTCMAQVIEGRGEHLPFKDASFDMISMGYGLRHVGDLRILFAEYRRVLKPGGRALILELSQPDSAAGRWLTRLYLGSVVPAVARLTGGAGSGRMMEYFWDTIENCVSPVEIVAALREAGFSDARRRVTGGVLSEYIGTRE